MLNKKHLGYLLCLGGLLTAACRTQPSYPYQIAGAQPDTLRYATLLELQRYGAATFCDILNPWDDTQLLASYLLLPRDTLLLPAAEAQRLVAAYPQYTPLYIPLQRITLTTGCHAYLVDALGAMDQVAVMCDASYTLVPAVAERLSQGLLVDGGSSVAPVGEVLRAVRSDAAWISPFENAGSALYTQCDVPVLFCADYMEHSPLARAEWMKLYGTLVGRRAEVDSLFRLVESHYLHLRTTPTDTAPKLLAENIVGSAWYIPGGCSTLGQLYADAGARYYWQDDPHSGSLPLSPEAVLQRAQDCDLWLLKYYQADSLLTLQAWADSHPYYPQFKAVQQHNVYGCNTALSPYFDQSPFRPDLLLYHLRRILRPELPATLCWALDSLGERRDSVTDPGYFHRLQ
jgi:iron complex transport system substrate-binding protein